MARFIAVWTLPIWFSASPTNQLTYLPTYHMVIFPRRWLSLKTGQGRENTVFFIFASQAHLKRIKTFIEQMSWKYLFLPTYISDSKWSREVETSGIPLMVTRSDQFTKWVVFRNYHATNKLVILTLWSVLWSGLKHKSRFLSLRVLASLVCLISKHETQMLSKVTPILSINK